MKLLSIIVLFLAALTASAADVNGKWKASFTTPDGQTRENTFEFKVDGDKLTGTVTGAAGSAPIQDGKVSGDEISFSITRNFGGSDIQFHYKGQVVSDEIKLTVTVGERSLEMTAKRAQS